MKKLKGIILCGGQSLRMGEDKSLLVYHGIPQRNYLYAMLEPLCDGVMMSCNRNQVSSVPETYNILVDGKVYENTGPVGALLTAFESDPESDILVLGCDYPFLRTEDIKQLIGSWDKSFMASTFFNPDSGFAEPLLGIYSEKCYPILLNQFNQKEYSLRHFLKKVNANQQIPSSLLSIQGINTKAERTEAVQKLKAQQA